MRAKKYLQQASRSLFLISQLNTEINRLASKLIPSGINYEGDRVQTSPEDRMLKIIAEMDEIKRDNSEQVIKACQTYRVISRQIHDIDNELYMRILTHRYLNGMSFKKIADTLGYGEDWVKHKHGDALIAFERQYPSILEDH